MKAKKNTRMVCPETVVANAQIQCETISVDCTLDRIESTTKRLQFAKNTKLNSVNSFLDAVLYQMLSANLNRG